MLAILSAAALLIPLNQGTRINIPAGVYSYPQLAETMSFDGRTVTCDSPLKDRCAFVRLSNRDWQSATSLLSGGLGIAFQPNRMSPDEYTLSAAREQADREARWLTKM